MSETLDAPELVVFIEESDYESIKDIFIHREVASRSRLKYKDIHSKYHTDKIMSSISNEIEQDFHKFVRKRNALQNLMKNDEDDGLHDKSKEFQIRNSVTLKPTEPLADDNSHLSEVCEAESESTLHLSDSSLTTMSSSPDEFIQASEQPRKDKMSRSLTGSSQNEIAHGDSDSCSGPDSISLRSSSSTASFAFPILQSEWNGSPVRMAEADPSQGRKHQSWRTCFLCM